MHAQILSTTGLLIAAIGAFLLFRFGLPFGQRHEGNIYLVAEQEDEESLSEERRRDVIGWIGFSLGMLGVALQVTSIWWPGA